MTRVEDDIFTDKRVLQLDFVPERILHREPQMDRIRSILGDLANGVRPRNILCVGDFGTGKTAVIRSVCQELHEQSAEAYVNCSESNTQTRVIKSVLSEFNVPIKYGFPRDHYERLFKDEIARHPFVILVLDEVDKLIQHRDSEFEELFYALSRSINNVVTILLTNRLSFELELLSVLDSRVRDTFRLEHVEFGDYYANELSDIIKDRCEIGLRPTAFDSHIVAMIGRKSFEMGLRARGAIDLTRKSAELAVGGGHNRIEEDDVRQACLELSFERDSEIVRRLPPAHRAILGYIFSNACTCAEAYEWFQKSPYSEMAGRSLASFHSYLRDLETIGLVEKEKHGRGRGKGIWMKLMIPQSMIATVRKVCNPNDPPPHR